MDEVINYIMETPGNTNPNILKGMLENYVEPSGTIEITKNGTYDVTDFASADVNVTSPAWPYEVRLRNETGFNNGINVGYASKSGSYISLTINNTTVLTIRMQKTAADNYCNFDFHINVTSNTTANAIEVVYEKNGVIDGAPFQAVSDNKLLVYVRTSESVATNNLALVIRNKSN